MRHHLPTVGLIAWAAVSTACGEVSVEFDGSASSDSTTGALDASAQTDDAGGPDPNCAPPVESESNLGGFALLGLDPATALGGTDRVYTASGRLEVGDLDLGGGRPFQLLTVTTSTQPPITVGVLPPAPASTDDDVTLRVAVNSTGLRLVALIELFSSSGELLAAYWSASAPLEGSTVHRPALPMTVGPLTIDYEASSCEMIPWWAQDCGLRRMSELIVTTSNAERLRVPPGSTLDLGDGLIITNDPRSYHDAVFTNCFDVSGQGIGGFALRR